MAKAPQVAGNNAGGTTVSGSSQFVSAAVGDTDTDSTESRHWVTYRVAGVLSNVGVQLLANDRTGATLRSRVNGANGNQLVSIGASATGWFEDTTNTDTIAAGDEVAIQFSRGSGGTVSTVGTFACHFAATTDTTTKFRSTLNAALAGGNSGYVTVAGLGSSIQATESNVQAQTNVAGTWKNLQVNVSANTATGDATFTSRVNGAAGAQAVTVAAGTTGIFEDLSNSDTVAVDDQINYRFSVAAGTGSATLRSISTDFTTTDGSWPQFAGRDGGRAFTADAATAIGGGLSATSNNVAVPIRVGCTVSNLWLRASANTRNGAVVFYLVKNGTDTALSVSVTASTTGQFEDTTHSVTVADGDTLYIRADDTGSSGTLTVRSVSTKFVAAVTAASGTLTATLPALTGSLSGQAPAQATTAAALPAVTGALAGQAPARASTAAILPSATASLAAQAPAAAVIAGPLPAVTGQAEGDAPATGTGAGQLPQLVAQLVGTAPAAGVVDAALPGVTGTLAGAGPGGVTSAATVTAVLPALVASAAAQAAAGARTTATLPTLRAGLHAAAAATSTVTAALPPPTAALAATAAQPPAEATVTAVLPPLTGLLATRVLHPRRDITISVGAPHTRALAVGAPRAVGLAAAGPRARAFTTTGPHE